MRKYFFHFLYSVLMLLFVAVIPLRAIAADPVTFSIVPYSVSQQNMQGTMLVLTITPAADSYFYANDPGDTGKPLTVTPDTSPEGMTLRYPIGKPKPDAFNPTLMVNAHTGPSNVYVYIPGTSKVTQQSLTASLLICSDKSCWPVLKKITADWSTGQLQPAEKQSWWNDMLKLTAVRPPTPLQPEKQPSSALETAKRLGVQLPGTTTAPLKKLKSLGSSKDTMSMPVPQKGYSFTPQYFLQALEVASLSKALIFGLLAGLILNFMPCVLPVISLKLSTLVAASSVADEKARKSSFREHNLFFALGILVWFVALAVILSVAGLVWGQLFQNENIVIVLLLIVFTLALSTFGVFELPMLSLRASNNGENEEGRWQAFSTGLLATLLATPCSGPFLGGVLGWAFMQPPFVLGITFLSVGVGMALPYVAMAMWPGLIRVFPKPGNWTTVLEKIVGFFLMGTAAYLLTILPSSSLPAILIILWTIAALAWIAGRYATLAVSSVQRWGIRIAIPLLVVSVSLWALNTPKDAEPWQPFSKQAFMDDLGSKPLLLDFTADWCPNCKVLEHTVLTNKNRAAWAKEYDLTFIKVDLTRLNPDAQELLNALGSQSIPVVAIFPKGRASQSPTVLRDLFTTEQLNAALEKALEE